MSLFVFVTHKLHHQPVLKWAACYRDDHMLSINFDYRLFYPVRL